jgi:hypothetical protein
VLFAAGRTVAFTGTGIITGAVVFTGVVAFGGAVMLSRVELAVPFNCAHAEERSSAADSTNSNLAEAMAFAGCSD